MSALTTELGSGVNERRYRNRHRPLSIMYVKLGSGNGGILLNLSVGGLALQAAGKLNRNDDLTLCFQLVGTKQAIEVSGRVAWLGPTQKEAGVCFKDLSADLQQVIANWIVDQERTPVVEIDGQRALAPGRAKNKTLAFPSENQELTCVLKTTPAEPRSDAAVEDETEQRLLPIGSSSPQPDSIPYYQPSQSSGAPSKTLFDPYHLPDFSAASISSGDEALRQSPRPLVEAVSEGLQTNSVFVSSSWINWGRHRRLVLQIFGVCLVILALTLTAERILTSRPPAGASDPPATAQEILKPAHGSGSSIQRPAVLPPFPQNTAQPPISSTGSAEQPSQPPASGDIITIPAPSTDWASLFRKMFWGADEKPKMNPTLIVLPVWTFKQNGLYYCSDSPKFGKLEPGIGMTQGQALQSGYQPVTGSYCR